MSAVILLADRRRREPPVTGYAILYRQGETNRCPGCGRSHWHVGRFSAECAFCGCALPFAPQAPGKEC